MLADDNHQVVEYVREFLFANGCEVIGMVSDGQSAVGTAARLLPDVLVLDISMLVLDGIQSATHMLEISPSIKIVFLTVDRDPDTCRAAMATRACGYVLKPRLASDLIPAIELAKDGRRFVSSGCD